MLQTANIQRLALDPATDAVEAEAHWLTAGPLWSSPDPSPNGEWVTFWSPDGSRISTTAVVETGAATRAVLFDPNRSWAQQTPEQPPALKHPSPVFLANSPSPDAERLVGTAGLTPPLGIVTYPVGQDVRAAH